MKEGARKGTKEESARERKGEIVQEEEEESRQEGTGLVSGGGGAGGGKEEGGERQVAQERPAVDGCGWCGWRVDRVGCQWVGSG